MSRFTDESLATAREILSRYPVAKSAVIPLCHLAQEQDGHLTDDAMAHIAELTGVTAAEVLGTASFYEMFKRHECGRYVVNVGSVTRCAPDRGPSPAWAVIDEAAATVTYHHLQLTE